jgi:ankyrin repeat protein
MGGEEESIVELVGRGFLSEVLLLLTTQPSLSGEQDDRGNNVLHIAAKTGNMEMLQVLLKTIPPRLCLGLLSQRNRVSMLLFS